jgi:exopolysaccharide biosynthesis WecB/TagA/CpsF family protein
MRLRLLPALQDAGEQVCLVLVNRRGVLEGAFPAGLRVIDLCGRSALRSIPQLARLLWLDKPDICVSSLDHNNIALGIAKVLTCSSARIVFCQHNTLSAEAVLGWKYRVVPILYKLLSPWVDAFIAVSNGVSSDLIRITAIPPTKVNVIYNPACPDAIRPRRGNVWGHPWLLDDQITLYVFAGRLTEQKNPTLALNSFAVLRRQKMARFVFLGDGELSQRLEFMSHQLGVADDVLMAGYVEDVRPWLERAACCVVPSNYEGFGNVIVEALACGTPVVASDCPEGPREILAEGQYGVLFRVGDVEACATAMLRDLRLEFPKALLMERARHFSLGLCVNAHIDLFRRLKHERMARIFGLRFSQESAREVARSILTLGGLESGLVVTPNLDHVRLLQNQEFKAACALARYVCPDGFPVAAFCSLKSLRVFHRVTGCEILHEILSSQEVRFARVSIIVESIATYDSVVVWGRSFFQLGHFQVLHAPQMLLDDAAAGNRLAETIAAFAPNIVILTLGAPTSEIFYYRYLKYLTSYHVLCVGQALRIELGLVRRAPPLVQRIGCEWLWRILQEPKRMIPRYLRAVAWFPIAVAYDLLEGLRAAEK